MKRKAKTQSQKIVCLNTSQKEKNEESEESKEGYRKRGSHRSQRGKFVECQMSHLGPNERERLKGAHKNLAIKTSLVTWVRALQEAECGCRINQRGELKLLTRPNILMQFRLKFKGK